MLKTQTQSWTTNAEAVVVTDDIAYAGNDSVEVMRNQSRMTTQTQSRTLAQRRQNTDAYDDDTNAEAHYGVDAYAVDDEDGDADDNADDDAVRGRRRLSTRLTLTQYR